MRSDKDGIKSRHGVFRCPDDAYIGKSLRLYGEYSEKEVELLHALLKEGDIVVEAGAHVGTITVPIARRVGEKGKVLAFEPQSDICEILRHNLSQNVIKNVDVHNAALGMSSSPTNYQSNLHNTGGVPMGRGAKIATLTLLDSLKLDKLNLLKADVEGMEFDVLTGGRETIARCRPLLYVENDKPENSRRLYDTLFSLGYRVWRHQPMLFNADNFNRVIENPWGKIGSFNLLAIPVENDPPAVVAQLELKEVFKNQWAAVCRFGGIGDNLVAASVCPGLVLQGNKVEFITSDHYGVILENNPWIDKLSICKDGDQPGDGGLEWQRWFERRSHEYKGGLYHLSHTIEMTLAFVRAQCQFWWSPEMRRKLAHKSYIDMAHEVCGVPLAPAPLFYPTPLERMRADETKAKMGSKVVGWILGGSRFDKVYPYSVQAISRIIKELGVPVMMSGTPGKDFENAKIIERDVAKANGSVKGLHLALSKSVENPNWPVRRGLSQLLTCDVIIGPDTGGMWACAFERMPKVMLLSHASPENITKHWYNTTTLTADPRRVPCWPCHRLHDTVDTCVPNKDNDGVACMSDISVELIVETVRSLL